MKKLIVILVIAVAAHGFIAFGQNWVTVGEAGNNLVWDGFTNPGSSQIAPAGDVNLEVLWAMTGVTDPLAGTPTTGGSPPSASVITSMLLNGWTLMQDYNSGNGTAALGTVETTSAGTDFKGGGIIAFNRAISFEFSTTTAVASGGTIQFIWLGFDGGASSYLTATGLGVSADSTATVGTTASDPYAVFLETASPFGVIVPVPEPATLALAGLGGLSMLCLRRRKA